MSSRGVSCAAGHVAAVLAAGSAALSLYWAVGGTALATVGEQFVRLAEEGGAWPRAGLLLVAAGKLAGAGLAL